MTYLRMDRVDLPGIKATEWCDCVERMWLANMELIKEFVEYEKPEEHVAWYGEDGKKYGELKEFPPLLPEYKGMYVMDLVKMVYEYYTKGWPEAEADRSYLLSFCCEYLFGKKREVLIQVGDQEYYELKFDESTIPTDLKFFDGKDVDWKILDKYLDGDRSNLVKRDFLHKKLRQLENDIIRQKQKMLHVAIEVREYLWT